MSALRLIPYLALIVSSVASESARSQVKPTERVNPPLKEVSIDLDLSDPTKKPDPVIFLAPAEPYGDEKVEVVTGLLRRELYRQALLMAARDELGLTTRDAVLGELPPKDLPALTNRFQLDAWFVVNKEHEVKLTVGPAAASRVIWNSKAETFPVAAQLPIDAVLAAEALSRVGFLAAFKKAGQSGKPNPVDETATLSAEVEKLLGQMTFTSQFTAARLLHETIRTKGESTATLGAISRAYANLGMLTDTQWGGFPWVFKARGLLYAERLRQRDVKSPWGRWYRAYAAALAGMHDTALDDLKEANGLRGKTSVPDWATLADALCRFDSQRLKTASDQDGPLAETAAVFHFLSVENNKSPNLPLLVGEAVTKKIPECYRILDALAETGGVSVMHGSTLTGLTTMTKTFSSRVAEMPGLPKAVADAVEAKASEPDLVKALIEAGQSRTDRELSWAVLGQFARESRLVQVNGRLVFLRHILAVSPVEFLDEVRPLVADHPLNAFLDTYRLDPIRDREECQRRVVKIKVPELTYRHRMFLYFLTSMGDEGRVKYTNLGWMHGDNLYYDAYLGYRDFKPDQLNAAKFAKRMIARSPYAPMARAILIMQDWPNVKEQAAAWEKEAQHPEVFLALGRRAIAEKRVADAERVIERAIELSPDLVAYRLLADVYKQKGDTDKWIATLERVLKEPDVGLDHAQVRVQIAEHFMAKKEYAKAKPYADAAATSYAGWAMLCAARCCEGLEEWDTAEQWLKRAAERYEDSPQVWFFWCVRTRHGDQTAAKAVLEEYFKKAGLPRTARDLTMSGVMHAAAGEPDKAAGRFLAAYAMGKQDIYLLAAAFEFDSIGDTAKRDNTLAQVPKTGLYEPVVALIRETLAKGEKEVPSKEEMEAAVSKVPAAGQLDARYFLGRFLQKRGQTDPAREYLRVSSSVPATLYLLAPVLAGRALSELEKK